MSSTELPPVAWKPLTLTLVEYPENDKFGAFLALSSLLPIFISISHATWFLQSRDLHTLSFGIGVILNYIINFFLKISIKELRPEHPTRDPNTVWQQYGMPSTHSQFMGFYAAYITLFVAFRLHYEGQFLERLWKATLLFANAAVALLVMYGRVYLGYHTVEQVFYGCLIGTLLAYSWFWVVETLLTPWFPFVASLKVSEFFLIRDLTSIPNVIWFQFVNAKNESIQRNRSSVKRKKSKRT